MPNIIAIIDDKKARSQIESYFKELDGEGLRLRFFATGYEFEQKYFGNKKEQKPHPLHNQSGFDKLTYQQLDSSLAFPLVTKPVLPHAKMRMHLNLKTKKITALDPKADSNQTVFNRFPEDLLNQSNLFGQIVPTEFQPLWQDLLKNNNPAKNQILIALMGTEKELGWFKIGARKLNEDTLRLELEEVTETYREPIQAEIARRRANQEENDELQLLSEIDMVIFKSDCVSGKVPKWLDQTWSRLQEGGFFPKEKFTRFVLLKYEDDGVGKLDVMHNRLDDLIYLPIDRLIFLQKMEIMLALPMKATPSILFTQEVDLDIEISKLSKLERLSDLGLAIRNPVRLTNGLLGHFYLNFPDESAPLDVWGKVIHSEDHPDRPNEYLVYFSFFGMRKNDSLSLKRFLGKNTRYPTFIKSERQAFAFNAQDMFSAEEDKRIRQVAVLTLDDDVASQIRSNLPNDINQIRVVTESSYAEFLSRYIRGDGHRFAQPPSGAGENDLFAPALTLTVSAETLDLISSEVAPADGQFYFGEDAVAAFCTPEGWLKPIVAVEGNRDLLLEFARLALNGINVHRTMTAVTAAGDGKIFQMNISATGNADEVQIVLNVPNSEELKTKIAAEKIESLDLVIVDLRLVPGGNVAGFMETLTEQAKKKSLLKADALKFILIVPNEKHLNHRAWSHPDLIGLVVAPIEMRPISFLSAIALKSPYSIYRLDNMGWLHTLLPVHVAKDIKLELLSEFGAQLRHSRPIAPGTVLYLRGGIYENAPNRCLAARFYHCEDHPKEKGQYLCTAIYFGINDAFMKYARRWFRETYASSKQVQGQN